MAPVAPREETHAQSLRPAGRPAERPIRAVSGIDDQDLRDFYDLPGHIFRRALQRQVAIFSREVGPLGITGAQFVALSAVQRRPGMEQQELSAAIFYDVTNTGGIVKRLEVMGVLRRQPSGRSRRGRALYITAAGDTLLRQAAPAIARVSAALLSRLDPEEGAAMLALVSKATGLSNTFYAPETAPGAQDGAAARPPRHQWW